MCWDREQEHSDLIYLRKLLLDACEEVGAAKRLRSGSGPLPDRRARSCKG